MSDRDMARRYRRVRVEAERALGWAIFVEKLMNGEVNCLLDEDDSDDTPATNEQIQLYIKIAAERYLIAWRMFRHEYGV